MQLLHSLPTRTSDSPTVLTIGMFDGMHLGHAMLLEAVSRQAQTLAATKTLITFSNHPSSILRPQDTTPLICTIEHKLRILEQFGLDTLILLPFTREFSEQSADSFLQKLHKHFAIASLVLGSDATIGKNRAGDRETIKELSATLGFPVEYLADCTADGERVSSSKIRDLISKGNLAQASHLLGREYSIYAPVIRGDGRGKMLGFPTANIRVQELCLPPRGVYAATCRYQAKDYPAIANLGVAPTVKDMKAPLLEVHILDHTIDLYEQHVEIFFKHYIRPEQRFSNLDALKSQISNDIETVRR